MSNRINEIEKVIYPDCSIGCCISNLGNKFTDKIQYFIRLLNPPYDHSCLFVDWNDSQYVIESTLKFGIILTPFDSWKTSRNLKSYVVLKHKYYTDSKISEIKEEAFSLIGKKYDKRAIYHHLIDKTAGKLFGLKWTGQTDAGRAEDKYYCSEWIAKLFGIKDWWKVTPSGLSACEEFEIKYINHKK